MNIGIINAGVGSIHSLQNSLNILGYSSSTVSEFDSLSEFTHLIFPGVGHFDQGASFLSDQVLRKSLDIFLADPSKRLLGICLGMQLLFSSSEESILATPGLSLFDFPIKRLPVSEAKVPNLGWLSVTPVKSTNNFVNSSSQSRDFYFVHSYALFLNILSNPSEIFDEYSIAMHGDLPFIASFRSSNVFGCQFHPEKSSRYGLSLLLEFLG